MALLDDLKGLDAEGPEPAGHTRHPVPPPYLDAMDKFAAHAMTGYLAGCGGSDKDADFPSDATLAKWSYDAAEAMLAERARRRGA